MLVNLQEKYFFSFEGLIRSIKGVKHFVECDCKSTISFTATLNCQENF